MAGSVERVVAELEARLRDRTWDTGHRLPPERHLAAEFNLARNTLRQALKRLEERGVLIRQVGRGTFVQQPADAKSTGDFLGRMRNASPAEVMEMRLIIEPHAVVLAATRASAQDLGAIETALRNSILAKGTAEFEHWDAQIHLAIFRGAKNSLLIDYCEAINAVRNQPRWHRLKQRTVTPAQRSLYDRDHTTIVTALRERDAETARSAMIAHLTKVRDHLLALPV